MEVLKTYEAKGIDSSPSLKDNTNSHANVDGEMTGVRVKLKISQFYKENYSHLIKAESGRVFFGEKHTDWFSNTK